MPRAIRNPPLKHDSTVRALVGVIIAGTKNELVSSRVDIDNNALPSAVAVDPFGALVFAALLGNNRVVALDSRTGIEVVQSVLHTAIVATHA